MLEYSIAKITTVWLSTGGADFFVLVPLGSQNEEIYLARVELVINVNE